MKKSISSFKDMNNLYLNDDIFIIGNGVWLNNISADEKNKLRSKKTIGVNAASVFMPEMNIFISGHAVFMCMNDLFANPKDFMVFHGEPKSLKLHKMINLTDINVVTTNIYDLKNNIEDGEVLIGAEQVIFSATHLALVLGAKRIIYVGFDSRTAKHFYDYEPYSTIIKNYIARLLEKFQGDKFLYDDIRDFININISPRSIPDAYFPNEYPKIIKNYDSNLIKLQMIFKRLEQVYGIEVMTAESESLPADAGAKIININDVL